MSIQQAYDRWASQYDTNRNRTRDLEAQSLRETLAGQRFGRILEIGCGTGKNTAWLQGIGGEITAVDLSEGMLAEARRKVAQEHVTFLQADILGVWNFVQGEYDLVVFSLVLEHIEDLVPVFRKAAAALSPGGKVYVGELHPFKQYGGTKARFETSEGTEVVTCFDHHVSDFVTAAQQAGLRIAELKEYFDDGERGGVPRVLVMVFGKAGDRR
jgi:ubiquinone/menaquinone biosynthesis C-methylase UbiE